MVMKKTYKEVEEEEEEEEEEVVVAMGVEDLVVEDSEGGEARKSKCCYT